jgi:hypothetical protein
MKERVMTFSSWQVLQEAKRTLVEAEGVSRAIHGALQLFFDEHGKDGSYEQAKEYVASKVKGWDLSQEDFEEAKKELLKESLNEKDKKEDPDEWKKDFKKLLDSKGLDKKASVFPAEIDTVVTEFLNKHKDVEVDSSDVAAYAKELMGMEESENVNEGKMKEIDMISRESKSKAEFEAKLKEYVKSIGKAELADDKDFIEAMTDGWKPSEEEK